MPWHIEKREDEWCVIKDADGENEGCHPSEEKAKAQMSALYASENRFRDEAVEIRSSSISAIDKRQRIVDLIAVPWEQEAEVFTHGEMWREVFTRGAFDGIEDHAGRVRVNREHTFGDTVGKVVQFTNANDGLHAQVKIVNTQRGDETLALAEEDMISASVGYRVKKPSDVQINYRTRMRRVRRAFIDHLSLVEAPAYQGAQVLAVREGSSGLQASGERVPTPALDEAMNDPIFDWAKSRVESPES